MRTAIDTNVLLAFLYEGEFTDRSEELLQAAHASGAVAIIPIVYSELAADGHFASREHLDEFLEDLSIRVDEPSRTARFRAGRQFSRYTSRRPDGLQCPTCGAERAVTCASCDADLTPRQHIASDFLIGGHASADADELLSFDDGFYESYFPDAQVTA